MGMMEYANMMKDRHAVVTGGASGVGRAVALLFASQGAKVAILDGGGDETAKTLAELRAIRPDCFAFSGDLSSADEINRMCSEAVGALGCVDALVTAAGLYMTGSVADFSEADFKKMIDINVLSAIRCAKALAPAMMERRMGNIVTITSDLATSSLAGTAAIAACAGAMYAFTRNVTMDYPRYRVRANCILYPFDGIGGRKPLTGGAAEEDAANAALFYACDLSRNIMGNALPVNGGINYTRISAGGDL